MIIPFSPTIDRYQAPDRVTNPYGDDSDGTMMVFLSTAVVLNLCQRLRCWLWCCQRLRCWMCLYDRRRTAAERLMTAVNTVTSIKF